jgi:hypothetical protein
MFKFLLVFVFTGFLCTSVEALSVSDEVKQLVINEVNKVYSSIWGLEYTTSTDSNCALTVTGFAKKNNYYGESTFQFWVCIIKDDGNTYSAMLQEDIQIADE